MIKIKASVLREFLLKTTANGTITDGKLQFTDKGLEMYHKDEPGVIAVCGILNKANFPEYEIMSLNVKSTDQILKGLKTTKDNIINIVKQGNNVKIMDENGGFDLSQAEKILLFLEGGVPGLTYDHSVLVKKSMVDDIIEKSKIVSSDEMKIVNKDKKLMFVVGNEADSAYAEALSSVEKEYSSEFEIMYIDTLASVLDPIFNLSIGGKVPSRFEEKTDKYNVIYFLTPKTLVEAKKPSE
jgi:hypothetical protein